MSEQTAEEIADEILCMGKTCREFYVGKIIFSGLVVRRGIWEAEVKRRAINSLLKSHCREEGYIFIEHDNIKLNDIENKPRDKVRLLERYY